MNKSARIPAILAAIAPLICAQAPPTNVQIVQRAQQILNSAERWNRSDSGKCPADAAKTYSHRLMDYNNDKATTFADVQKFFAILEDRIRKRIAGVKTQ